MHYYQFNIGDYTSHTARLSLIEDLAYRRLLDLYYLNERPFNGTSTDIARDIGLQDYQSEVDYILNKFFPFEDNVWRNKRADKELAFYHNRKKAAIRAGKASGKARRSKAKERTLNACSTNPQPTSNQQPITSNQQPITNNHKPVTNNQKTNSKNKHPVELKPDDVLGIFQLWQTTFKHPKAAFDKRRQALIRKQLKKYSKQDLESAIIGCSVTPHNMGDNDRGEVYDSIELILGDSKHIDRFMANALNPPSGKIKTISQTVNESQAQADRVKKSMGIH